MATIDQYNNLLDELCNDEETRRIALKSAKDEFRKNNRNRKNSC